MSEIRAGVAMLDSLESAPKVTFFGSARTASQSPSALLANETAQALAARGWFIMTGAGPGIMDAATRGAGPDRAIGIDIDLPGERMPVVPEHVLKAKTETTYFFSRKILLTRSADAFVVLPGGFGTLDEMFEVLNLLLTHKSAPVPVVLLESPGGTYWTRLLQFIGEEVVAAGYSNDDYLAAITHCTSSVEAVNAVVSFYANVRSVSFGPHGIAVTTRFRPTEDQIEQVRETVDAPCLYDDAAGVLYVTLRGRAYGRVREAIDVVNSWR